MKALIGSFFLFLLLLGGILINSRYIVGLGEALLSELSEIPDYTQAGEEQDSLRESGVASLTKRWEAARMAVSVSVNSRLEGEIDEAISRLQSALHHKEAGEFDHARRRLILLLGDLMRHEKFDPRSIV